MVKETNVQIDSIKEESFSINYEKIPKSKDDCSILIGYSCIVYPEKSTLSVMMWIRLQEKENSGLDKEDIVSLRYSYTVHIENLASFIEKQDNDNAAVTLPKEIWETLLGDAYATGRVLLALKLADTSLKDFYLPFNKPIFNK